MVTKFGEIPTSHFWVMAEKIETYGSVQEKVSSFSKNKTKHFDHYMDYY